MPGRKQVVKTIDFSFSIIEDLSVFSFHELTLFTFARPNRLDSCFHVLFAKVVELVDTSDSKSDASNSVWVRVPPLVHIRIKNITVDRKSYI